ncbi:unnamed protein product [Symbiodinium sp. CCMP2456]|nr:unnamed protein product [Symbiodinium sp. CCMP2456]
MARTKRAVYPSTETPRKRMTSDLQELSVHVRFAASGETLVTLRLRPQMVVSKVRERVNRSLDLGLVVTSLLQGAAILSESVRLGELTSEGSEVTLDAVVTLETALCMFRPCAAGDLVDIVREEDRHRRHCDMSKAPSAAKAVAEALNSAAPDLESTRIIGGSKASGDGGQVIVIANPGSDALSACQQALAIDDEDQEQEQEWTPGQIYASAIPGRLRHLRFQDRLEVGFNRDDFDEPGEEDRVESQLQAATQIMCDKLSSHFEFDLGRCLTGPVIFGGFCEDGSIVGVLASRRLHVSCRRSPQP